MPPLPAAPLPTIFHWHRAAGTDGIFSEVLQVSNFGGKGPLPVGASGSLGPFGTFDLAGNVKEWVWNESSAGRRFVLGGAWFEAAHAFNDEDARGPFTRDAGFGFRCMLPGAPLDASLTRPVVTLERDTAALVPVGDEVFQAYKRLYDYDPRPLDGSRRRARRGPDRLDHRARVVHRRLRQRARADDADAAAHRPPAVPGGRLLPGIRCRAGALEPRRLHAVAAVPAAQRPRRGVPDLPADLRAPPDVHRRQLPARDQHPARARTCVAPSTTWRRDPTSTRRRSRSTA